MQSSTWLCPNHVLLAACASLAHACAAARLIAGDLVQRHQLGRRGAAGGVAAARHAQRRCSWRTRRAAASTAGDLAQRHQLGMRRGEADRRDLVGVIAESVPKRTLSRVEELCARIS
jgi:hypothetical protein